MKLIRNTLNTTIATMRLVTRRLIIYKANMVGYVTSLPIKLLVSYTVWSSIFTMQSSDEIARYSLSSLILYYMFITIIEYIINPYCTITYEMYIDARESRMDIYMTKPLSYVYYRYIEKASTLVPGYVIYALACMALMQYKNISVWNFIESSITIVTGTIIMYVLFAIIGTLAFRHENILTLRDNIWNIIKLLSGVIIPIAMYPAPLDIVARVLPFRYIYALPIEIILDTLGEEEILVQIGLSIVWALVLTCILVNQWRTSVREYTSQGG